MALFNITYDTTTPIALTKGSSLENIAFWYPEQTLNAAPNAYPATVELLNVGGNQPDYTHLNNINFGNAYIACQCATNHVGFSAEHVVGCPLYIGFDFTCGLDPDVFNYVHFSPAYHADMWSRPVQKAWVEDHGIAFLLGGGGFHLRECWVMYYNIGYDFYFDADWTFNGITGYSSMMNHLSHIGCDWCKSRGIRMDRVHGSTIEGSYLNAGYETSPTASSAAVAMELNRCYDMSIGPNSYLSDGSGIVINGGRDISISGGNVFDIDRGNGLYNYAISLLSTISGTLDGISINGVVINGNGVWGSTTNLYGVVASSSVANLAFVGNIIKNCAAGSLQSAAVGNVIGFNRVKASPAIDTSGATGTNEIAHNARDA
jgi:hypothetical protein